MAHETPLSRLENYQPTWVGYHRRYLKSLVTTRSGVKCGDSHLENSYQAVNSHMDGLLETYFTSISNTVFKDMVGNLAPVVTPQDIPIKHTKLIHPAQGYDA